MRNERTDDLACKENLKEFHKHDMSTYIHVSIVISIGLYRKGAVIDECIKFLRKKVAAGK